MPSRDTVLGTLQADIIELAHRGVGDGRQAPLELPEGDRSLAIHVCHSPMREMQVLRDVILDAFATDPTLRPDQVFVLAPDIAKYAPFVEAVFGVAHEGEPTLRFTIADRTARAEAPLVDAAQKLLDLVGSRVVASEVLALLDAAAVRRAARIEASEIETVRNWVTSVPIRWGMDGQHRREALGLPSAKLEATDAADTWRGGLDRLLLGYAVGNEDELVAGKLPSSLAASDADLLGRFTMFVDRLFRALERLADPRKLEEWARDLRSSFAAIVKPGDEAEESALRALLEATDRIGRQQVLAACDEKVTIEIVRDAIRSELEAAGGGAGFISGAITFCSLQPMRAIPAKLIAIAGLDDEAFPRRDRPPSFDLIAAEARSGDRSAKKDDRNVFLETLLAARERLILSYVGRSQKDNGELAPSSALAELSSALDRTFLTIDSRPASAYLTTVHALQPFDARYFKRGGEDFDGASSLQSFSATNFEAARAQLEDARQDLPFVSGGVKSKEHTHEIELSDLIEFWVNPSKHFCTSTLGIRLASEDAAAEDVEPFALGSLPRYQVLNHILQRRLAGRAAGEDELDLLRSSGMLPHADLARVFYESLRDEVDELVATVESLFGGRPRMCPPVAIDVRQERWHLVGVLSTVTERGQLRYRPATLRPKDRLRAWISHLALNAHMPQSTFLVGKSEKNNKNETPYFATCMKPVENAAAHLDGLVRGFVDGLVRPLPVFENASYEYASRVHEAATGAGKGKGSSKTKDPFAAAREEFRTSGFGGPGDDADPYVKLCVRGRDPLVVERERFEILSRGLWAPLLDASEEIET